MKNFPPVKFVKERHHQLFNLIKENKLRLFFGMVCSGAVAASTSGTAWLMKPAIDDVFVKQDLLKLKLIPIVVVVLFLLRGLGYYGQGFFMNYVGQRIIKKLRFIFL
jgi:subfamily B ATP-binding cassette protein MsbA